jgi:mannan endo-1,4-beta-mannosidase
LRHEQLAVVLLGLGLACQPRATAKPATSAAQQPTIIKKRFVVDGKPFCFAGTNNYYLIFKPRPMVDAVLEAAAAMDLKVVRTWGFLDRGALDASVPNVDGEGHKEGVYFQYWDPVAGMPRYNDGPDGLERLDYALVKAAALGLKLIVVLTNNWHPFGGIDQYNTWYGIERHHEFYTDQRTRAAYRDWALHVVTRKNALNGLAYRDDPTIFAWELANEPRCKSGSRFDSSEGWSTSTLTNWAQEMSAFIKSIDANHLVSVGDEGFLNGGGQHWTYKANDGVDHAALLALPEVDFGTFHMYPEDWRVGPEWADQWIRDHLEIADDLGKPTLLEEYGIKVKRDAAGAIVEGLRERESSYRRWNELMLRGGGAGSLFWMLADREGQGLYPDYDRFTIYRGHETAELLTSVARRFATAFACRDEFPPLDASEIERLGLEDIDVAPNTPFVSVQLSTRTR